MMHMNRTIYMNKIELLAAVYIHTDTCTKTQKHNDNDNYNDIH